MLRLPQLAVLVALVAGACASADDAPASSPDTTATATIVASDGSTTSSVLPLTSVVVEETTTTVATTTPSDVLVDEPPIDDRGVRAGAERRSYEVGPLAVKSGQNNIAITLPGIPKPDSGYITRIDPDLRLADGTIPAVDDIHLHHGVWLNVRARDTTSRGPERFFAAGEEKTITMLPDGYGYPVQTDDVWMLNYMIHNLWPEETEVWVTYEVDVIPFDAPEAAGMVPARPVWMDVQNGQLYPVFDVLRGDGTDGRYTYPDDATDPYGDRPPRNVWTVDRDGYLLSTAGHLHPGGLHTDLWLDRAGEQAHLFSSEAYYYEPAGAVSWDVSMTTTPEDWRVAVKAGDVLSTNATYDSGTAAWYESMGIMVTWMADSLAPGDVGPDPFTTDVAVRGGLTHGHLAENDGHGGEEAPEYLDLATLPTSGPTSQIPIADYVYAEGDMLQGRSVPTVRLGESITFDNLDAPLGNGIWHTITACKAPCNRSTGIAYPLADGEVQFDSGQLGVAGPPTAGRTTWSTPSDLEPGLYTYFCRIHPFMRGGFEVVTS